MARSLGRVGLPVVIRIPVGGGIGAVEHHSAESTRRTSPTAGLGRRAPTQPMPTGSSREAIAADDPVVFYEPKRRYWDKGELDESRGVAPMSQASVVRTGSGCHGRPLGPMVKTCLQAAAQAAAEEGTSLEVIDLRSVSRSTRHLAASVEQGPAGSSPSTEASGFLGIGAEVAAQVQQRCFYSLEAPVIRVTGYDVPYPRAGSRRTSSPTWTGCSTPSTGHWPTDLALEEGLIRCVHRRVPPPDPGEGLTEAEIVTRKVAVGDTVKVNDIVVEIETAKSLVELPIPYAGTVSACTSPRARSSRSVRMIITVETGAWGVGSVRQGVGPRRPKSQAPATTSAAAPRRRPSRRARSAGPPRPVAPPSLAGYGVNADRAVRRPRRKDAIVPRYRRQSGEHIDTPRTPGSPRSSRRMRPRSAGQPHPRRARRAPGRGGPRAPALASPGAQVRQGPRRRPARCAGPDRAVQ